MHSYDARAGTDVSKVINYADILIHGIKLETEDEAWREGLWILSDQSDCGAGDGVVRRIVSSNKKVTLVLVMRRRQKHVFVHRINIEFAQHPAMLAFVARSDLMVCDGGVDETIAY